jgi:hypothetical protein
MFIILQVATTQFALPHFVSEQASIVADPPAAFLSSLVTAQFCLQFSI